MANYNIYEQDNDTFVTKKEGASKASSSGDGKQDSWQQGQYLAHTSGGGTVTQYDKNGNIIRQKYVD
ncbi:MAG: DUF2188 domain-containing protein [Treponema sp.]|nr:DUF2188 domain-containing protein [Treponema sp.]